MTREERIAEIRELDKNRTQGKWGFNYYPHIGQYSSICNEDGDVVLQATGRNDGDEGLQWFDEEFKEADQALMEKVPDMIELIKELQEENKKLKEEINRLNEGLTNSYMCGAFDAKKQLNKEEIND